MSWVQGGCYELNKEYAHLSKRKLDYFCCHVDGCREPVVVVREDYRPKERMTVLFGLCEKHKDTSRPVSNNALDYLEDLHQLETKKGK